MTDAPARRGAEDEPSTLALMMPIDGWVAPLDETPDEVFARRMLGDGVAIDPTGSVVRAPCDGEIVSLARTGHAVTLRAINGAEILIHVGLDTVALEGDGFETHVRPGQRVAGGAPLLSFDIDLLAQRATSLLTPVVVVGDGFEVLPGGLNRRAAAGELLMRLRPRARIGPAGGGQAAGASTASRHLRLPLRSGLHARPAAQLAKAAARFASEIEVSANGRQANAKSIVALMTLGAAYGETLVLQAEGPDAEPALAELVKVIVTHPEAEPTDQALASNQAAPRATIPVGPATLIPGVQASPGLAVGPAVQFAHAELEFAVEGRGVAHERQALAEALDQVRAGLSERMRAGGEAGTILGAHLAFLDDPELGAGAERLIAEGRSAGSAWREVVEAAAAPLRTVADQHLQARVDDLIDVERRVLRSIAGAEETPGAFPAGAIVLARELLPSDLTGFDVSRIAGVCTVAGGPTSHVAILAAGLGIPMLVGAGPRLLTVPDGAEVILDADAGVLHTRPDAATLQAALARVARERTRAEQAHASAGEPCRTLDGARIQVLANLGSEADAHAAAAQGAEGSGLVRTEFLFLDRADPPSEDEQHRSYQAIADALPGRPILIRTLDIGADKPAPYLRLPHEDNPALGVRGIRVSLAHPDLLETQLRAILRVKTTGERHIMLPMVSGVEEVRAVRAILDPLLRQDHRGREAKLGVMIETPAAAAISPQLAAEADFFSIGSNDLAQYALAMDRGDARLSRVADALHPAILRLIAMTTEGAARQARPVSVCGGLGADPAAVPLLLGLGVTGFSVPPSRIGVVRARIRSLALPLCRELAEEALSQADAAAVRALVQARLPDDQEGDVA